MLCGCVASGEVLISGAFFDGGEQTVVLSSAGASYVATAATSAPAAAPAAGSDGSGGFVSAEDDDDEDDDSDVDYDSDDDDERQIAVSEALAAAGRASPSVSPAASPEAPVVPTARTPGGTAEGAYEPFDAPDEPAPSPYLYKQLQSCAVASATRAPPTPARTPAPCGTAAMRGTPASAVAARATPHPAARAPYRPPARATAPLSSPPPRTEPASPYLYDETSPEPGAAPTPAARKRVTPRAPAAPLAPVAAAPAPPEVEGASPYLYGGKVKQRKARVKPAATRSSVNINTLLLAVIAALMAYIAYVHAPPPPGAGAIAASLEPLLLPLRKGLMAWQGVCVSSAHTALLIPSAFLPWLRLGGGVWTAFLAIACHLLAEGTLWWRDSLATPACALLSYASGACLSGARLVVGALLRGVGDTAAFGYAHTSPPGRLLALVFAAVMVSVWCCVVSCVTEQVEETDTAPSVPLPRRKWWKQLPRAERRAHGRHAWGWLHGRHAWGLRCPPPRAPP